MRFRIVPIRSLVATLVFAGALAGGCASRPPQPLAAPQTTLLLTHFTGTPLSGPTTRRADASAGSGAVSVHVQLLALTSLDAAGLKSLQSLHSIDPQVRLITANRGGTPVLPAADLTQACRFASGEEAQQAWAAALALKPVRAVDLAAYQLAIPPGVTASIRAGDAKATDSSPRGIELLVSRPEMDQSALDLAIVMEDVPAVKVEPDAAAEGGTAAAAAPANAGESPAAELVQTPIREMAVLRDVRLDPAATIAVLIPFHFSDSSASIVLVLIRAEPAAPGAERDEALAKCAEDLRQSAALAAAQPSVSTLHVADAPAVQALLKGLANANTRRATLAYLTMESGASVCEDASLVADDHALAGMVEAILVQVPQKSPTTQAAPTTQTAQTGQPSLTRDTLGWALDVAALRYMSKLQSTGKLPQELLAVLLRHTGQVGSNVGSVEEIVRASSGRKDFESRVTAENFVYLEDNSPAARVRAYDWLNARGNAPAGYVPLGAPRDRYEALQKAYDAMAAAAASAKGGKP